MRVVFLAALVGAALARPAPISAQQTPNTLATPRAGGDANAIKALPASPWPPLDRRAWPTLLQQPAIVCGMTLLPADPKLDAAIRHPVPEDGPTSVITILEPRDCRR